MADDAQLPVLASFRAAWTFFAENWTRFVPAAALAALGAFVFWQAVAAPTPLRVVIGIVAGLGPAVAYRAAALRFALHGEFGGLFGLKFGEDEGRLAAVIALYSLFLFLVFLCVFTPFSLVVMGLVAAAGDPAGVEAAAGDSAAAFAALGPAGQIGLVIGWIGVVILMLFVWARLILCAPATIAERRIVFLQSWPWTRGSTLRLVAAVVLAAAPGFAAQWVLGLLALACAGAGLATLAAFLSLSGALAGAVIGGMMGAGLQAFLYRGLRPPEAAPAP